MIPLFSTSQVREVDDYAINTLGVSGLVLMENAALQIFNKIIGNTNHLEKLNQIGIVCGKGNNGGDGFALARQFANHGFNVKVIYLGNESEMSPDCLSNYKILLNLSKENQNIFIKKFASIKDLKFINDSDIILDALLGSGSHGMLREPYNSIINSLNKIGAFKAAIDIPTGLNSDSGYAENCFNADVTITLGELKRGLFIEDGYVNCGVIEKGDIGIGFSYFDKLKTSEYLIEPEDVFYNLPIKKKNAHKYSTGKVLTIAGSGSFPGAARMTAKSALKIGAGASILCYPKSVRKLIFNKATEIVVNSYEDNGKEYLTVSNIKEFEKKLEWADAAAIGPGLGREPETQDAVIEILKKKKCKHIVIDADGIFALNNDRYKNINLEGIILTPHHGEFANLVGIETSELRKNVLFYGKKFVEDTGAYLILKGAPTIIFTPNGDALINTTGNPGMAKFGTGDVLTGTIAGLLAQMKDSEKAIVSGVYIHSLAADLLLNEFTDYGYTAENIIKKLPDAVKFLISSFYAGK